MRHWNYRDENGDLKEDTLTDEQVTVDQQIVREFECLEGEVSRGRDVNAPQYEAQRTAVATLLKHVTEARANHWRRELSRIGIELPTEQKTEKKTKKQD